MCGCTGSKAQSTSPTARVSSSGRARSTSMPMNRAAAARIEAPGVKQEGDILARILFHNAPGLKSGERLYPPMKYGEFWYINEEFARSRSGWFDIQTEPVAEPA